MTRKLAQKILTAKVTNYFELLLDETEGLMEHVLNSKLTLPHKHY